MATGRQNGVGRCLGSQKGPSPARGALSLGSKTQVTPKAASPRRTPAKPHNYPNSHATPTHLPFAKAHKAALVAKWSRRDIPSRLCIAFAPCPPGLCRRLLRFCTRSSDGGEARHRTLKEQIAQQRAVERLAQEPPRRPRRPSRSPWANLDGRQLFAESAASSFARTGQGALRPRQQPARGPMRRLTASKGGAAAAQRGRSSGDNAAEQEFDLQHLERVWLDRVTTPLFCTRQNCRQNRVRCLSA